MPPGPLLRVSPRTFPLSENRADDNTAGLLVDAPKLAYRAWFNRERREGPEAAATLFIVALRTEADALTATQRIAAVERSCSFRFRLFEGYKASRKERTLELKTFIDTLPALAHQAGYEVWHSPDHEADDVMATPASGSTPPPCPRPWYPRCSPCPWTGRTTRSALAGRLYLRLRQAWGDDATLADEVLRSELRCRGVEA